MRRFLIWSGLSVVIGLVLAVSGYLAYDYFYARFQPVTIVRGQGEIQRLLDEASWVSPGGGDQPLYIIGYRDSASTQAYERQETDKLRAGGVDVRVLMFARPDHDGVAQSTPVERATIAQLWLTRDWSLYRRWTSMPSASWTGEGLPPTDGSLARSAVVEASRQFVARLDTLMRDAGIKPTWPLVIWRDRQGFMKACACSDSRSWAFIRDDFGAPDAIRPTGSPVDTSLTAPNVQPQSQTQTQGLPYPNLGPPITGAPLPAIPNGTPNTGQPGGVTPADPSATPAPGASRPAARPAPRRPAGPKPIPPEDTQFF